MSTCISREGEYSDHETGDWCPRCGAFNEAAIVAERDNLRAAHADIKTEYADFRRDRQEQMTRIREALDDAYRGARTGNLMTPPWVVQSIDDARAAGGWTLPPVHANGSPDV